MDLRPNGGLGGQYPGDSLQEPGRSDYAGAVTHAGLCFHHKSVDLVFPKFNLHLEAELFLLQGKYLLVVEFAGSRVFLVAELIYSRFTGSLLDGEILDFLFQLVDIIRQ
jgi:hypothetical protein